ncbi:cobaltochelatase subunit CobN [Methanolobus sp. ZRKC2]|uniref:cobaltochelatase subunit CobN n=1 Tax=Methanolobus sp. ZRKC2 TaxID=3125783 RepID=UPI0032498BF7
MRIVDIGAGTGANQSFLKAEKALQSSGYDVEVFSFSSENLDSDERMFQECLGLIKSADFIVLRLHGGTAYFKKFPRMKEILLSLDAPIFIQSEIQEEMHELKYLFKLADSNFNIVNTYIQLAGEENSKALFLWALKYLANLDISVPEPIYPKIDGVYHPDFEKDISLEDYIGKLDSCRPTVGIMFWQGQWLTGDLKAVDALIRSLEIEGMSVLPVFCQSAPNTVTGSLGVRKVVEQYFIKDNQTIIDVLILNMGFSQLSLSSPGDGKTKEAIFNFFNLLDVPVLQAMTTYYSYDEWNESIQGLGAMEISSNIVWPEYDGQIITVPIASIESGEGHGTREAVPIMPRISKVARLAKKWAQLRKTPVSERKLAIILHQNPPRSDGIGGAFGLDAPQSVVEMLGSLRKAGYNVENIPENGNEVVEEILAGVSNDCEWLSPEDMKTRASALIPESQYREWFETIPQLPASQICRDWGEPPGDFFVCDKSLVIPGVKNGNIFIGLQPPRGFLEQVETMYHNTDLVMPHHYLAYYRWLKEEFGVHAIIHLGTHGTLEWLPGKAVGMSDNCFPDIVLDDIPNLYPYIMDNPGEGIQAKRRSWAVILDHLIPAMARADGYDAILDLEIKLQDYFRAKSGIENVKTEQLLEDIYHDIIELELLNDLHLKNDITPEEIETELERLYDYLCDVKDNIIKDGLHIFGRAPSGKRFEEMVYSLTRIKNGQVPSLRESIARNMGLELRDLQDNPAELHLGKGNLKGILLEEVDELAKELIDKMGERNYDSKQCFTICDAHFPNHNEKIRQVVSHICASIAPNLRKSTEEMLNCMRGLDGAYVPPGLSGSPTRGNSHLIPTGKNFYSIDPAVIPTPASWEVGKGLAEQMIEKHINEEGTYPESVGIVVFATDTMKTGGDDIAYILWLMGLRPLWSARGGVITGLEVIPLEELGRPRVDVTLRISGLFRDAFPNLVDLIDEGVETIAMLDESDDENYLRKHLQQDLIDSIKEGLSKQEAQERALVRIFGCPPGTYGVGVGELVESSKWSEKKDLADTYVTWGAHAYTRKLKGEKMPDLFKQRLARLDVTVKNHNSREMDILDNDDDFMYHGGMVASVNTYGNKNPVSVVGDSSDPDRLKTRTIDEEGRFVFRSRILNPKWLEGLKPHGYRGAQELSAMVDYAFGWDATADMMDDWMYQAVSEKFLFDEETKQWIEENNPYALRQMAGRLLEAVQRGMWDADDETVQKLTEIYLETEDILEGMNLIYRPLLR